MGATRIEWADLVWNPITGCSPISEGCNNCYAEHMAKRLAGRFGYPKDKPFRVTSHPGRLEQPFRWKKPRRILVVSMGDLFHSFWGCWTVKERMFEIMNKCSRHIFMLLTKRPHTMELYIDLKENWSERTALYPWKKQPPANIWLGVTAENQERANERIPTLLNVPAARRFVSLEPLLGPVDISYWLPDKPDDIPWNEDNTTLSWVVVGAETGPGARPMKLEWARNIRDQCAETGTPFFMKAVSGDGPIPDDLMVRELLV